MYNYYFHHATNIFHVYQKSKKKKISNIKYMNYPIELKKGNVCKVYKSSRWWGGFILSKVYNQHATIKYEVYGEQEHIKIYSIQNERE